MQITNNNYQLYSQCEQKINATSKSDSFKIDSTKTEPLNEQYIKNYNKIISAISKNDSSTPYPIATAEQSVQFFQEQQQNGLRMSPLLAPNSNLTDEFTDSYIKTYSNLDEKKSSLFLSLTMGAGLPTVEEINNKDILNSSSDTKNYISSVIDLFEKYEKEYPSQEYHSVNKNLFQQFYDNYLKALENKEIENRTILNSYL